MMRPTISELTRQYWLKIFDGWAQARLPPPQYDEAHAVLVQAGLPVEPDDAPREPEPGS